METDYIRLKEIKPQLAEYIHEAQLLLKQSAIPDDQAVHDMRVLLKKSRAVLKLIGPQVQNEYSTKDYENLREAARLMSSWRDLTVIRKNLKELKKKYPELFLRLIENQKLTELLKKPEPAAEPDAEIVTQVGQIEQILQKTAYRIRFQGMQELDPHLLLEELGKTYSRAADTFLLCRNNPKARNLHELRKKSKDFLYQLYFFRPLNNRAIKDVEKQLDVLSKNLGKINDLTGVLNATGYRFHDEANTPAMNELAVRIREQQDKYLEKIWPLASKIYMPGKNLVNVLGYKLLII